MHLFFALEGSDGAGKTTLRKLAFRAAQQAGIELLSIIPNSWRDPSATATIVRAKYGGVTMPYETLLAAYVRDKELLSARVIRRQLDDRPVLSDRYAASDMVYHHVLWNSSLRQTYEAYAASSVRPPDLTFYIDTPPEISFERMLERGMADRNRWDQLDKQKRIYELYGEVLFSGSFPWLGPVERVLNIGDREQVAQVFIRRLLALLQSSSVRRSRRSEDE